MAFSVFVLLFVALVVLVVGLVVILVVIRSTFGKGVEPDEDEDAPALTLLERAQEAVEALPPDAREDFRRWLDSRWPLPRPDDRSEGITT